jgi:hypothetical protein
VTKKEVSSGNAWHNKIIFGWLGFAVGKNTNVSIKKNEINNTARDR